eukprot:3308031-Amphidinium_carterae.1
MPQLKSAFEWGSWVTLTPSQELEYTGKTIRVHPDGLKHGGVIVVQQRFIQGSSVGVVPSMRGRADPHLTPSELTEFRSAAGALQWISGQTRPDVSAGTSLLQGSNPTVQDLKEMFDLLHWAKSTQEVGVRVMPIPLDRPVFIAFGDSSFANAQGGRTQAGLAVCLAHESEVLRGTNIVSSLWEWKSHRLRR